MARPKSKTQKKIDNNICSALTQVCESALLTVPGFQWITHQVDYTHFPASLLVTCIFDTAQMLQQATDQGHKETLKRLIQAKLLSVGVKFVALNKQVTFDTEEACLSGHGGDWQRRLASRKLSAVVKH